MIEVIDEVKKLMIQHWQETEDYPFTELVYEQLHKKLCSAFDERVGNLLFDALVLEIINEKDRIQNVDDYY